METTAVKEEIGKDILQARQAQPLLLESEMQEMTNAINELVTTVIRIIITHDPDECAHTNKYNTPCDTCRSISELRRPARTIIRLSEKMRRGGGER